MFLFLGGGAGVKELHFYVERCSGSNCTRRSVKRILKKYVVAVSYCLCVLFAWIHSFEMPKGYLSMCVCAEYCKPWNQNLLKCCELQILAAKWFRMIAFVTGISIFFDRHDHFEMTVLFCLELVHSFTGMAGCFDWYNLVHIEMIVFLGLELGSTHSLVTMSVLPLIQFIFLLNFQMMVSSMACPQ